MVKIRLKKLGHYPKEVADLLVGYNMKVVRSIILAFCWAAFILNIQASEEKCRRVMTEAYEESNVEVFPITLSYLLHVLIWLLVLYHFQK